LPDPAGRIPLMIRLELRRDRPGERVRTALCHENDVSVPPGKQRTVQVSVSTAGLTGESGWLLAGAETSGRKKSRSVDESAPPKLQNLL